jgi:hypothetical protein
MRERSRHHFYVAGYKLRKGKRYEFRAYDPVGRRIVLSGWFIADSQNPVCKGFT